MKVVASSVCVGPVLDDLRTMIGFEVFFCRIWYFLLAEQRRAYPALVAVGLDEVIVRLREC
jgi:hypothetical protein